MLRRRAASPLLAALPPSLFAVAPPASASAGAAADGAECLALLQPLCCAFIALVAHNAALHVASKPGACEALGSGLVYRLAAGSAAVPLQPAAARLASYWSQNQNGSLAVPRLYGLLASVAAAAIGSLQSVMLLATEGKEQPYGHALLSTLCQPAKVRARLEEIILAWHCAQVAGAAAAAARRADCRSC